MTNELRQMVMSKLSNIRTGYGINGIYFQIAQDDAMYPHVVFDFDNIIPLTNDRNRRDYKLVIDAYDKDSSAVLINNLADAIEDLFDQKNIPQNNSLPTIYFEGRKNIPDEDKKIRHIQITFVIQNYER